jgi:hypothetical protein
MTIDEAAKAAQALSSQERAQLVRDALASQYRRVTPRSDQTPLDTRAPKPSQAPASARPVAAPQKVLKAVTIADTATTEDIEREIQKAEAIVRANPDGKVVIRGVGFRALATASQSTSARLMPASKIA